MAPTYDYRCPSGHKFDRFEKMSDDKPKSCPVCHKKAKRQLGAGGGALFKGPGFYSTDNKKS